MIHPLRLSVPTKIQQKVERSLRLVVTKLQGGGGGSEVMKNKRSSGQRSWEEQPVFPEGGGRGIKKCVGGEQIFSEVASKNHHRNLKYFSFLL